MASKRRQSSRDEDESPRIPAATLEGRENQLIQAAVDLAEKQIMDGTASAQVITHFLKLGTTRERLDQKKLEHEIKVLEKRAEAMESAKRVEELYGAALDAMRAYAGYGSLELDEDDDY